MEVRVRGRLDIPPGDTSEEESSDERPRQRCEDEIRGKVLRRETKRKGERETSSSCLKKDWYGAITGCFILFM